MERNVEPAAPCPDIGPYPPLSHALLIGQPDEVRRPHVANQAAQGSHSLRAIRQEKKPEASQLAVPDSFVPPVMFVLKTGLVVDDLLAYEHVLSILFLDQLELALHTLPLALQAGDVVFFHPCGSHLLVWLKQLVGRTGHDQALGVGGGEVVRSDHQFGHLDLAHRLAKVADWVVWLIGTYTVLVIRSLGTKK